MSMSEEERSEIVSKAITVGDHSWVPVGFLGGPDDYAEEILDLLRCFELKHSKFAVVGWRVEWNEHDPHRNNCPTILGLWIDHRRRRK